MLVQTVFEACCCCNTRKKAELKKLADEANGCSRTHWWNTMLWYNICIVAYAKLVMV